MFLSFFWKLTSWQAVIVLQNDTREVDFTSPHICLQIDNVYI